MSEQTTSDVTPARARRSSAWKLRIALVGLACMGIVLGTVFGIRAAAQTSDPASANRAVVDSRSTSAVIGQVSSALNEVLSYSYANPAVAQAAATRWLTGDAVAQYRLLFTQLREHAPGQKLSFVTKVVTAGVVTLHGHTADLLVFLDQRATRASDHQSSVAAAQVLITAVRHGSGWQISELRPI